MPWTAINQSLDIKRRLLYGAGLAPPRRKGLLRSCQEYVSIISVSILSERQMCVPTFSPYGCVHGCLMGAFEVQAPWRCLALEVAERCLRGAFEAPARCLGCCSEVP